MNIHTIYNFVLPLFRRRRMRNFVKTFGSTSKTKILDVGGSPYNWKLIDIRSKITLLNLSHPQKTKDELDRFRFVVGNGLELKYANSEFDICYSNSVIEHVGTYENQIKFAKEVQRVAQRIWVQTPARSFFIEPHLITPFIHFLPKSLQRNLLRNFTVWGWLGRPSQDRVDEFLAEVRLINFNEMKQLFPDCEIYVERFLGMPKAYIAVRK